MATEEILTISVQESIVTCIAFGTDDNSAFIAGATDQALLDPPINDIAARCLDYRKKYKRAPGRQHIDDVLGDILENQAHKQHDAYQRVLRGMLHLEKNLNTRFVADMVYEFNRRRLQRAAIQQAANIYQESKANAADTIDEIFRSTLKNTHLLARNTGFALSDTAALGFLDRSVNDFCYLGIDQFDKIGLYPTKKELLIFLAARNRGKSMFLNHCGKMAMLKGWRIVHYTLENSAEITAQRYFQTLYSGVKRPGDYHYTTFDGADGLRTSVLKPDFVISNRKATEKFLNKKLQDKYEYLLPNLRIKSFPTGTLSFDMFERDLDEMALVEGFEPDMVLLDYPQIMKFRRGDSQWASIEELSIQLRGSAVERNYALVAPQQGNRASEKAGTVYGHMGGGSIGMLAVADNAITYSQSEAEEKHGLARLYAAKVRNDVARLTLMISQHYPSGQFCMDSRFMNADLREKVNTFVGVPNATEDEGEEDD